MFIIKRISVQTTGAQPLIIKGLMIIEAALEIKQQLKANLLLLPRVEKKLLPRCGLSFLKRSQLKITK